MNEERFHIGQWVAPYTVDDGDITALQVKSISLRFGAECYALSDESVWAVETGEPLDRKWKGHRLRDLPGGFIAHRLQELLTRILERSDLDTMAKMYAAMLGALR